MTRDIGRMDTPPYGTPIQPMADQVTPAETPSGLLRKAGPQVAETLDDIYVLGRCFAKPRDWPSGALTYYFRPGQQNYDSLEGGMELNNRFMVPFRQVTGGSAYLDEFHGIVGRLGACFKFPDNAHFFSSNFDAWHDIILKSFFLEMLKLSNPTAGETLARVWKHNMDNFTKADNLLRSISTLSQADDYTRAAALRVFGYTAHFFAQCHKTCRQGTMDHLDSFQTHQNPLVATAAMLSLRTLSGIGR